MSASAKKTYRPETRLVQSGTLRSPFGETSEALFLTQGYVYDSAAQVMRGIGSLLALQTACFVCALNNGMGKLGPKLDKNLSRNKQNFTNLIVMQGQAENKFPRGTKRGSGVTLTAGGSPYF